MTDTGATASNELPDDALDFARQLFDGARTGAAELVISAVEQGVPVNLTDQQGNSLLMLAAYHGHEALCEALLRLGADVDQPNDRGQTPLAGAVFKRYLEVMRVLIAAGANLDAGTPSARDTAHMFQVPLGDDTGTQPGE